MAESSWAERRGRMVKCKIHGLHFDPEMSTGCTLCLRDAAKAGRTARPPQLVLILLCLLGMAGIVLYISGQSKTTGPIDLGVASNPATTSSRLDPEPYREQIENLETALFGIPIEQAEDLLVASGDIRSAARELSSTILRAEPVDGLKAADRIALLGQGVPNNQVVFADIQRARDQWARIRKELFLAVDWYSEPAAAGTGPGISIADYSEVASGVRGVIEDGASEIEQITDTVDADPGDLDPLLRWRTHARGLLHELDSLEGRLPARPAADAQAKLLVAIQDLEEALSLARSLATSADIPLVDDPRIEDGINAALRAQQGFDDIAP